MRFLIYFLTLRKKNRKETSGSYHIFLVALSDSARDSQEIRMISKGCNFCPTVTSG